MRRAHGKDLFKVCLQKAGISAARSAVFPVRYPRHSIYILSFAFGQLALFECAMDDAEQCKEPLARTDR